MSITILQLLRPPFPLTSEKIKNQVLVSQKKTFVSQRNTSRRFLGRNPPSIEVHFEKLAPHPEMSWDSLRLVYVALHRTFHLCDPSPQTNLTVRVGWHGEQNLQPTCSVLNFGCQLRHDFLDSGNCGAPCLNLSPRWVQESLGVCDPVTEPVPLPSRPPPSDLPLRDPRHQSP